MLDPLKFQVAIQDNATKQLEDIEKKLKSLQDTQTVNIKVEGADQLKQIFETLNRGTANNAANDVKVSIEEMIAAIAASRKAVKNNSFDDFAVSIGNAYQSLTKLTEQLSKFGTAISQDSNLKNFVSGLGAVIQDVQNTMGSLKGRELGLNDKESEIYIRNVQKIEDALYRIQRARSEVSQAIGVAKGNGMNTDGMQMHLQFLESYEARLRDIKSMNAVLSTNGWQTEVFGSSYKQLLSESKDLVSYVNQATRYQARQNDSMRVAGRAVSDLALKFNKLELAEVRANAVKAGIDTTAYDKAIERVERYQRVLDYIAQNGGHDASRITRSVGFREATNDLTLQTAALNKNTSSTNTATDSASKLTEQERQLAQAIKGANDEGRNQSSILNDLKSLAMQYLGVWGSQEFLRNIIQIGGQLESQRLSLTAILGQASYANDLYAKIQALAIKSPFGVVQLDQYSKQLSAFGFEYNELFDTTSRLADIAAGTGTDFGRLALAIGHVRSELALTGYTLRQFSMANVPMLKMLAENLGVTTSEIRKMVREKKVSYEDVMTVIKELTDEGGMFYKMQDVMSEAVSAKFKNLKDSMDIMYGQMAESFVGDALKGVAATLTEVTKRWKTFGTVIASSIAFVSLYRTAMMLASNAQKAASTNLLKSVVFTKQVTAAEIENLIAKKQLQVQDVALALAQGRLNREQAEGILLANGYTAEMVKQIIATQGLSGATKGLQMKLNGLKTALLNPFALSLVAIEAVVGAVMAYVSWSDKIEDNITSYLEKQKTASQEISKYLKEAKESGKPTNSGELSGEIEQMKTILKNSEMYTDELEMQVNLAPSLSAEYDVLIKKMESANDQLKKMGANAEMLAASVKSTSTNMGSAWEFLYMTGPGTLWDMGKSLFTKGNVFIGGVKDRLDFFLNDDINKNVNDLSKSMDAFSRQMAALDDYKDNMQVAIENAIKFGDVNKDMAERMSNRPLEEQIRILAEDDEAWDRFVEHVGQGSEDFEKHAEKLKDAAEDVSKDWHEITDDDIPKMMEKMREQYGMDEKEFKHWANTHKIEFGTMLNDMLANADEVAPQIGAAIRRGIFSWLRGEDVDTGLAPKNETPAQKEARLKREAIAERNKKVKGYGTEGLYAMRTLREYAKEAGLGDAKGNGLFDVDFVAKYFKAGQATADSFDTITKDFKKARENYEAAQKTNNKEEVQRFKKEYERLDAAMDAFGLDKSDKSHKDTKNKGEDPVAKALRERVRVLKEVGDAYQYWREKIGDTGAFAHVDEEFGGLLSDLGITIDNISDLRGKLSEIYAQTEGIRDEKVKTETRKEISKELAQLGRKDFEKKTEDFLSRTQIELDNLTRAWDEFNQVLDATGNIDLARSISGATYISGVIETAADAVRQKVKNDYRNAGGKAGGLSFNAFLSDKEIEEEVRNGAPRGEGESLAQYEERIKSLTEEYKKWRDLQKQQHTTDLQRYANILGGMVDYQSQLNKLEEEYKQTLEAINRLNLSDEEKKKAIDVATAKKNSEAWHLTASYSNLYNNAMGMSSTAFYDAFKKEMTDLDKLFKAGAITADDYNKKVADLNKIEREFSQRGFLGIHGGVGAFLSGGVSGLSSYYRSREQEARRRGKEGVDEANKWKERADALDDQQRAAEEAAKSLQDLSNVANMLGKMFDALGMEGTANAFSDAGAVLGGVASGAQSLSAFGPWGMAAGAAIGGITSLAEMHDKKRERQIEALRQDVQKIDNTLNTIKSLRERSLGYDNGDLRRSLYEMYANQKGKTIKLGSKKITVYNASTIAMKEYYSRGGLIGSGYRQEYEGLKKQREDYLRMYDAENGKKKSSAAALEEFKAKIAELDEKIIFFGQDLAKELWGIDVKGWATQISDALMTAFENGEDAAKAFRDTVRTIMQNVANNILKLQIVEPMMSRLNDKLFGYVDNKGKTHNGVVTTEDILNNPKAAAEKIFNATNEFMNEEGNAMITAGKALYNKLNGLAGGILDNQKDSALSGGIKGITEQTADLLASYLNAIRADASLIREMQTTYFEEFKRSLIDGNATLATISQHTNAIMISNDRIAEYTESVDSLMRGLRNGVWRIPVE